MAILALELCRAAKSNDKFCYNVFGPKEFNFFGKPHIGEKIKISINPKKKKNEKYESFLNQIHRLQ